jgi:hypothetical protein
MIGKVIYKFANLISCYSLVFKVRFEQIKKHITNSLYETTRTVKKTIKTTEWDVIVIGGANGFLELRRCSKQGIKQFWLKQ